MTLALQRRDHAVTPDHDEQQASADQLLAATLQLGVAVDQLVKPSTERLDRARPENDPDTQADLAHDAAQLEEQRRRDSTILVRLYQRHADASRRRDKAAKRRIMDELLRHGDRVRRDQLERERQAAARAATTAELPSLLDQLRDAVESRKGAGDRATSVHRSAIGFAAAELLAKIERTVGYRPGHDLAADVRDWADNLTADNNPTMLPEAALAAEQWVAEARGILNPDTTFGVDAPCPTCGNRWAWLPDDTGQRVRKDALQVNTRERVARCLAPGCTGHWREPMWKLLIAQLNQDREQRAG